VLILTKRINSITEFAYDLAVFHHQIK